MTTGDDDLVRVGHVLGAQGLKGWVRVYSHTSPRENIVDYGPWLIDRGAGLEPVEVQGRLQGKHVLARLAGVEDRDQAENLAGSQIFIRRGQLPGLGDGEYYWSDLIGLRVETLDGTSLGAIAAMVETGADDVMSVQGDRQRLIPFALESIVREVDLAGGRIVVDWSADY